MNRKLKVVATIDRPEPAAWVVELLRRLDSGSQFELAVLRAEKLPAYNASTPTDASGDHTCSTYSSPGWLMQRIDKPLFNHDPWKGTELPASISTLTLESEQQAAVTRSDVVISLCSQDRKLPAVNNPKLPYWTARFHGLADRVEHHLLQNAPLMWLHLWDIKADPENSEPELARITSHSLPCHTYSITDLRRLSFASLPALFESRLNWMANSAGVLAKIETLELSQGVFDTERAAADADAEQWCKRTSSENRFSTTINTFQVLRVLKRQFYERLRAFFF